MNGFQFSGQQLNALLAGVVIAVGAWLAWDALSPIGAVLVGVGAAACLLWQGRTISQIWAWATMLLGLESFSWPVLTMVQIRMAAAEPTEEQMGTMLSAVVAGLLSAVFWVSFSYGLFKRDRRSANDETGTTVPSTRSLPEPGKSRKRR